MPRVFAEDARFAADAERLKRFGETIILNLGSQAGPAHFMERFTGRGDPRLFKRLVVYHARAFFARERALQVLPALQQMSKLESFEIAQPLEGETAELPGWVWDFVPPSVSILILSKQHLADPAPLVRWISGKPKSVEIEVVLEGNKELGSRARLQTAYAALRRGALATVSFKNTGTRTNVASALLGISELSGVRPGVPPKGKGKWNVNLLSWQHSGLQGAPSSLWYPLYDIAFPSVLEHGLLPGMGLVLVLEGAPPSLVQAPLPSVLNYLVVEPYRDPLRQSGPFRPSPVAQDLFQNNPGLDTIVINTPVPDGFSFAFLKNSPARVFVASRAGLGASHRLELFAVLASMPNLHRVCLRENFTLFAGISPEGARAFSNTLRPNAYVDLSGCFPPDVKFKVIPGVATVLPPDYGGRDAFHTKFEMQEEEPEAPEEAEQVDEVAMVVEALSKQFKLVV